MPSPVPPTYPRTHLHHPMPGTCLSPCLPPTATGGGAHTRGGPGAVCSPAACRTRANGVMGKGVEGGRGRYLAWLARRSLRGTPAAQRAQMSHVGGEPGGRRARRGRSCGAAGDPSGRSSSSSISMQQQHARRRSRVGLARGIGTSTRHMRQGRDNHIPRSHGLKRRPPRGGDSVRALESHPLHPRPASALAGIGRGRAFRHG